MKKFTAIAIAVLCIAFVLVSAACGGNDGPKEVTKSAEAIYALVSTAGKFGGMTAVPARDMEDVYGVDPSKIAESAWYMSENPSLNADEAGIFKVNDAAYADTLAGLLRDRIARQLQVAETYSPDEAAKLKAAQVVTAGDWVYYCVGAENAAMMEVLRAEIG
ncbi:MAG: DUF4358 domain-containing protein [Clostridia bacterium]|nr:DUF4358 domain-containing protein [Clostridia bacterium]